MISSRTERLQLFVVLAVAALLRMAYPGMTEFKADEARLYALAYDLAAGQNVPLSGIGSSIGIPNFPLSAWLYAFPLTLWKHPYAATLFTGLLNAAAVLACWWVARRYWGARTGILAAFFFAVSPWAIIFSRKIWAQNLLPLFVIGWAISAFLTFAHGRRRAAFAHGVLLGCVPQIHFSGLALLPISVVTGMLFRRRVAWRWLAAGAAVAAAFAAPLAFHLAAQGFPSLTGLTASPPRFGPDSLTFTWMLSTGADIHSLAGNPGYLDYMQTVPNLAPMRWLWGALIAFGGWRLIRPTQGRECSIVARLIIAWLVAPAFLSLWSPVSMHPHYFIITFPAQFIAAAVGAIALLDKLAHPSQRAAGWGLLLASGILQLWALIALFQFSSLRATPGGFGSPLSMKLAAVESARAALRVGPATEVLIAGSGNDPAVHQFPAVYDALLRGTPHRFVDANASAVRPTTPTVVLLQPEPHPARQLYREWSTRATSIPLRVGEGSLQVLELPVPTDDFIPPQEFYPPRTLANGVTLLGYEPLPSSQNELRWALHWRAGDEADTDYHFFNHLLDASGTRVGQADARSFPANQWREGDRVISLFSAILPDSPETLRVGMYTYPDVENVPVVDESGGIIGQAVSARWTSP
ncbi:MAG: hypothetical protein QF376_03370 [Anaerolineales bacterium]|nr:hypothetical protein [Anaerolineales bacterium]